MIKLKEGQKVIAENGDEYIIEKGDIIQTLKEGFSEMIIKSYEDFISVPKNKLFYVEDSIWVGGGGHRRNIHAYEEIYIKKIDNKRIAFKDEDGEEFYFHPNEPLVFYDMNTAKKLPYITIYFD